ncbi:hypothetical protein EJB05_38421, partial [Eragrostis curvula]
MESFKLSVLCLISFLLLAAVAEVAGDELTTFIVHVQPQGNHPFAELCGNGSLDGVDVKGKIVLCVLGSGPGRNISRILKGAVVASAGAVTVIPESMLNYPSISVTFQQTWNWSTPIIVQRTVKNVGEVPSAYYAAVDLLDDDVIVGVYPHELLFTEANQEQSFKVIVWPRQNGGKVIQGALRWVSDMHT